MFLSSSKTANSACNFSIFSILFFTFIQPSRSQPIPKTSSTPTPSGSPSKGTNDKTISAPIIIGICVATFLIIIVALIFILRKRRLQKKLERADQEAREAAEFVREMEERKRRLGSVYSGERRRMEKEGFSGIAPAPATRSEIEPPRRPEKVVLVPDNLW